MSFTTISVIGLGYIGLPTAAAFASRQKQVVGVDINARAVETINRGEIHIVEPDLDRVVKEAVDGGFLRASTTPVEADAYLIAVPTPFKGEHEPDMVYVEAAAKSIAPVLTKGALVILESTSPVGATEQMAQWLADARPDLSFPQQAGEQADINIAYCPERVLPGQVMVELIKNDRVIGGMTPVCSERASALYKIFLEGECVVTNSRTAEMCKLTENSFRDVNIAFANELSLICADQGINVWESPSAREHSSAGPGGGWTLYRRRSVVYRGAESGAGASDPYRARSERQQTSLGAQPGQSHGSRLSCRERQASQRAENRLLWPGV